MSRRPQPLSFDANSEGRVLTPANAIVVAEDR
jgi:hypothetical protein